MSCVNCQRLHELLNLKDKEIFHLHHDVEQKKILIDTLDRQRDEFRSGVLKDQEMFVKYEEVMRILEGLKDDEKIVCHKEAWGIAWQRERK